MKTIQNVNVKRTKKKRKIKSYFSAFLYQFDRRHLYASIKCIFFRSFSFSVRQCRISVSIAVLVICYRFFELLQLQFSRIGSWFSFSFRLPFHVHSNFQAKYYDYFDRKCNKIEMPRQRIEHRREMSGAESGEIDWSFGISELL